MALTQHITSTLVKTELGAVVDEWSQLIVHVDINKWSKYKPVRGNWPIGTSGTYGLNLPTNWNELKPRGGISNGEPFRTGDFRGYNHTALPPFELVLYPGATSETLYFALSINENDITVADLTLNDWYFGVKIGTVFFSAAYPLSNRALHIETVTINPTIADGAYDWEAYISSFPTSGGEVPDNIIPIPAAIGTVISGSTSYTAPSSSQPVTFDFTDVINTYGEFSFIIGGSFYANQTHYNAVNFTNSDIYINFDCGGGVNVPSNSSILDVIGGGYYETIIVTI